ncbi:MAG: hypothetical protein ACI4EX_05520 [Lachnospiraceae bacterium]
MIKLRNFLYLNTKVVEDYISVIEGFIYDEESYEIEHTNENLVEGNSSIKFFLKMERIQQRKQKVSLNREHRRKMPQNMDNPEGLRDVIKGPAIVVTQIAVYQ